MKRLAPVAVLILLACNAFSQSGKDYATQKTKALLLDNLKESGLFPYEVVPLSVEYTVIGWYPTWVEKRYSKQRMIAEAKAIADQDRGTVKALMTISFTGDFTSEGRTELKIPDDFAEYVFVENEKGNDFPCVKVDISPMGRTINSLNRTCVIVLTFSVTDDLYRGAESIIFTVGGLDLGDNVFKYRLPFSLDYQDCPEEIREVLVESGIWQ